MPAPLSPAQEAQAQQLARALAQAAHEDFLRMARTLIAKGDADLFGDTEFEIRDAALRLAARINDPQLLCLREATDPKLGGRLHLTSVEFADGQLEATIAGGGETPQEHTGRIQQEFQQAVRRPTWEWRKSGQTRKELPAGV